MADVETQARALGWVPKEEFRGDEARWVDATTFVKKGEEYMPLLRANNARLQSQVENLASELTTAQTAIKESQEAMAALVEGQTAMTLQAVKDTRTRLKAQIRVAREANDWDAIDELEDQLDSVRETERKIEAKAAAPVAPPPPPAAPAAPQIDPEFKEWMAENPWFGKDKRKTALMMAEGQELREDPANKGLKGRAFYDRAAEAAEAILNPRSAHSKVENGTGSGTPSSSSGSGGKTYADLPADAKEACIGMSKRLVGPNKAFKDQKAWEKHYAEQYFLQE